MPAEVVTPLETMESWEEEIFTELGHIIAFVQNGQVRLGLLCLVTLAVGSYLLQCCIGRRSDLLHGEVHHFAGK